MFPRSLLALLLIAGLAGCGGTSTHRGTGSAAVHPATTRATASHQSAPFAPVAPVVPVAPVAPVAPAARAKPGPRQGRPRPRRPPGPPPGTLPQTDQRPSADTPGFRAEMTALWHGVLTGSVAPAIEAFFPERAYVQVKAIADPAADWAGRLVGAYGLDIAAAHRLLGPDPGSARLLRVQVPAGFAHWIPPEVCYNRVGYYEVPNARVLYTQDGSVRSFGIASMISWRGVWYVVHLGAVVRSGAGGLVDAPAAGPGVSTPSSTC